jgi:uncharacterized phiE125 gp8 family phage protein
MSLSADALVTWAQAKAYLTLTDANQAAYEPVIEMASGLVSKLTGRKLAQQTITEQLDGPGGTLVMLTEWPVVSITSLHVDAARVFGAGTEVAGYYCEQHGALTMPFAVAEGKGTVKAVYVAGFDVVGGKVPADLQEAVLEVVAWLKKRVASNQIGVRSVSGPEGITTAFETMIPLHAAKIIDLYRKVR